MRPLAFALGVLALASSDARAQDAAQYRHFELSDGRSFEAIVLATEPSGFRIRVPQGEMRVPFPQLRDMQPSDQAAYEGQPDWYVYLATPEERRRGVLAALDAIPHLVVHGQSDAPMGRLTSQQDLAASACGTDLTCIGTATQSAPWMWIVSVNQEGADLVFQARTNLDVGPARNPMRAQMIDGAQIGDSAWRVLEVTPVVEQVAAAPVPDPKEKPVREPRAPSSGGSSAKLAFVPLPGVTALANKDYAGFGLAMATAVPATALWVGAVGQQATRPAEHIALGVGGFYAITVALNNAVAHRGGSTPVVIGMAPRKGGAEVQVTVAR